MTADATLNGNASSDYFGYTVGRGGDYDGDGNDDLTIGAYGEDTGNSSAGAIYVFMGPVTGTIGAASSDAMLTGPSGGDGYLGRTLVGPIDFNDDGADDLLGAGYWIDTAAYDAGAFVGLLGGSL